MRAFECLPRSKSVGVVESVQCAWQRLRRGKIAIRTHVRSRLHRPSQWDRSDGKQAPQCAGLKKRHSAALAIGVHIVAAGTSCLIASAASPLSQTLVAALLQHVPTAPPLRRLLRRLDAFWLVKYRLEQRMRSLSSVLIAAPDALKELKGRYSRFEERFGCEGCRIVGRQGG